jgi:type I restriction enzyme M protein
MVATTNVAGMVGVVMPHGVLFRGASRRRHPQGAASRRTWSNRSSGLPTNLFYGTGIPAATQNYLRDEDVREIATTFHAFKDVEKYAKVVGLEEVERNDWNLNISRYVETTDAAEKIDVSHALAKLRELERKRGEAEARMNAFLRELGYGEN